MKLRYRAENQVVRRRKDGKVALRQGDESVWLDYEQIRALEYDKGEYYFDGELTRDLTLEDIDHEALRAYKDALGTASVTRSCYVAKAC